VRPAPASRRESLAATTALEITLPAANLRLRSGNERRQAVNAAIVRNHGLRLVLRLKLRLTAMLAMVIAIAITRLMLFALLIWLSIALMVARIVVALLVGLRLHRDEAGLLPETGKAVVVLAFFRSHFIIGPRLRLVLTELFLRGGDQAKVMLGVLIIILGGYRVA